MPRRRRPAGRSSSPGRSRSAPARRPSTGSSMIGRPSRNMPFTTSWTVPSPPTATRNRTPASIASVASARRVPGPSVTWSEYSSPRSARPRSAPGARADTPLPACGLAITARVPNGLAVMAASYARPPCTRRRRASRIAARLRGTAPPSRRSATSSIWRSRSMSCLQLRTKSPGAISVSSRTSSSGFPSAQWNTGVAKPASSSGRAPPGARPRSGGSAATGAGAARSAPWSPRSGSSPEQRDALARLVDDGVSERRDLGRPRGRRTAPPRAPPPPAGRPRRRSASSVRPFGVSRPAVDVAERLQHGQHPVELPRERLRADHGSVAPRPPSALERSARVAQRSCFAPLGTRRARMRRRERLQARRLPLDLRVGRRAAPLAVA